MVSKSIEAEAKLQPAQRLSMKVDDRDLLSDNEFNFLSTLTVPRLSTITDAITVRIKWHTLLCYDLDNHLFSFTFLQETCEPCLTALQTCGDDEMKCARASAALQFCMASIVCKDQADAFLAVSEKEPEKASAAFTEVGGCLERFQRQAAKIRKYHNALQEQEAAAAAAEAKEE